MALNPGFAKYLADKKANKASMPTTPTTGVPGMMMAPPMPGAPKGKRHSKIKVKLHKKGK